MGTDPTLGDQAEAAQAPETWGPPGQAHVGMRVLNICSVKEPAAQPRDHRASSECQMLDTSSDNHVTEERGRSHSKDSAASATTSEDSTSLGATTINSITVEKVNPLAVTVMLAGSVLACCSGMINAIAFHMLSAFVTHVTGTISKVGLHAENGAQADATETAGLVLSFLLGSWLCGLLIEKNTVSLNSSHYGVALIGVAALLVATTFTADQPSVAKNLAAAAAGLQNGMATSYSGAVIRTSHVTGIVTDIGLIVGRLCMQFIRMQCGSGSDKGSCGADDVKKLALLILLASSFLMGIVLGVLAYNTWRVHAFLVPAAICGGAGVAYMIWRCVSSILQENVAIPDIEQGPLHGKRENGRASQRSAWEEKPISEARTIKWLVI